MKMIGFLILACAMVGAQAYTSLFATCDNLMKIYFDGVLQFEDEGWPGTDTYQWRTTTELVIPSGTKVLGIECKDLGWEKGILASTPDGLVTDGSWQCSHNENLVGWAKPGFEDSAGDFSEALIINGPVASMRNIDNSAQWIWADQGHSWAACKKTFGTPLFATCDNKMRIYFDGVLQFEDEGWPGTITWAWTTTTELVIPSGTKVLGIECKNLGGPEGIIASTPDGLRTDGSWQCSHNENLVGWADPDFVETAEDFNTAINVGGYTNDGEAWGIRPGIDTSSQWIWADQGHSWAACRKKIGPST